MCTLILAWQVFDGTPIAVAANRDEAVDRPSTPPRMIDEEPSVVAPLDERAGGTWIGYNDEGVFAAITNRWLDVDLDGDRSRGLLVRDALKCRSAVQAAETVGEAVESHAYEGFNLVIADGSDAQLLAWDGELTRTDFDPGVHVVVNVGTDDHVEIPTFENVDDETARRRRAIARKQGEAAGRARSVLEPSENEPVQEWLDRAVDLLRSHEEGFCVHRDGFGTRSSSVITIGSDSRGHFEFADGPPCETPYEPIGTERTPDCR